MEWHSLTSLIKREFIDFITWKPDEGAKRKVTAGNLLFGVITWILIIAAVFMIRLGWVRPF